MQWRMKNTGVLKEMAMILFRNKSGMATPPELQMLLKNMIYKQFVINRILNSLWLNRDQSHPFKI